MIFWIGILVGAMFAWFAIKMGFYETWAMLFNIVISIYLAIFLKPIIGQIIPAVDDTQYNDALTILTIATGAFLILHGITYVFFTGQFSVSFGKVFDILGAGLLGFLAGFLVWSFAALLIYVTPISQHTFAKEVGFDGQFQQTNIPYICRWCDLVNMAVSSRQNKYITEEAIRRLAEDGEQKKRRTEMTEPAGPSEPNDILDSISEESQLGSITEREIND